MHRTLDGVARCTSDRAKERGLFASQRARRRTLGLWLGFLLLAALGPGAGAARAKPLPAGPCDTWTNTSGGDWNTAADWSSGVPTASTDVCITQSGAYTVTINGESATANTVTVSGGPTLSIQATDFCSGANNASLTLSNGGSVDSLSALKLSHVGGCANGQPTLAVNAGTLSSAGTIAMDPGSSDNNRFVQGNVTSTGTLAVNAKTVINAAGTLDNQGSLTVASGENLTFASGAGATLNNDTGGSISNASGTGYVYLDSGNTFLEGAGTTNPSGINPTNPAVYLHGSGLQYTGSGKSSVVFRGSGNLSGNLAAVQALTIQATDFCGGAENATATASSSFTSAGQIMLTHTGGCANGQPTLAITGGGTLSSSGTITMDPGSSDNNRYLQGNVTNTGTLAINAKTVMNTAGTLTNQGSLTVATGETLTIPSATGATVINGSGGSIDNGGSTGYVYLDTGNTFVQGAGTTSPSGINPTNAAVYLHGSDLHYTGKGQSSVVFRGTASLKGDLGSKQALTIQATDFCGGAENATASASSSFTSAGQIMLTHAGGCANGQPTLAMTGGATLTSSGAITMDPGSSDNTRYLQGNVTNTGTLTVNANTVINAAGTLDNQGSLAVASGESLTVANGAGTTVDNDTGGSITNASGTGYVFLGDGNTFVQGAGTTSPSGINPASPAVLLRNSNLQYTGTGQSSIVYRGSGNLSGSLGSGQALTIQATDFCGGAENATASASSSFSSAGQIMLTHTGNCSNGQPTLAVTSGTLTNSGTLTMDPGSSDNNRYLQGNVTNTGTLAINAKTVVNAAGTLDNQGALTVASGENLTVPSATGLTLKNDTGGSIDNSSGTGYVYVDSGNTFTQGAGTTNPSAVNPTHPAVYLHGANLSYSGTGQSSIVFRGSGNLSGNLGSQQALTVQATDFCGGAENATATVSSSITSAGQIMLTHAGNCSNGQPTLAVTGGKLTSSGTLTMDPGSSDNNRYLQGNVTNTGTLAINAKTVVNAAGTLDNQGALTVASGENLTVTSGTGATVNNDTGGSIDNGGGSGYVYLDGGNVLIEGGGTTNPSGINPTNPVVYVHSSALHYAGSGQSSVVARGAVSLIGDLAPGQALTVQATDFCGGAEDATATATSGFTNAGQIMLTHSGNCNNGTPRLTVTGGGTIQNSGVMSFAGSPQTPQVNSNLDNEGTVSLAQVANLSGNYTQGAYAFLEPVVSGTGAGQYGQLAGAQNLTLNGTLMMNPSPAYTTSASLGDTIPVISYSGTLSGAFCDAGSNPPLSSGNSFDPDYSHPGLVTAIVSSSAPPNTCPPPPAAPAATTDPPTAVTTTSAVLHGTVNPGNAPTTYHFDYGTSKAYGHQIPVPDASAGSDGLNHAETQSLSGLLANKTYHYRIVAGNSQGTVHGKDETFTTSTSPPSSAPPLASTDPATDITDSTATLHGTVNPENAATTYHFEYGPTKAYGQQIPVPDASVGSDASDHAESQSPSGLLASTTYHYRMVATNSQGTTRGADETFTTALPPPVAGVSVNLFLTSGVVFVQQPGGHRRRLTRPEQVRIGSILDTRHGEVEIEAARSTVPGQPPEYARFYDGVFQIEQQPSVHAVAHARLYGGHVKCHAAISPARTGRKSAHVPAFRPSRAPSHRRDRVGRPRHVKGWARSLAPAAAILLPLAVSGTAVLVLVSAALALALILVMTGGVPRRILSRAVKRPLFLVAVFALGGIATAGVWLAVSPSSAPRGHATLQLSRPKGGSNSHTTVAATPTHAGARGHGHGVSGPGRTSTAPASGSTSSPRSSKKPSSPGSTTPSTPPSHGHNPGSGHNHKPPSSGKGSRSLWAVTQGPGNWQTNGTYASATVRGTQWLTKDECTGTLVQVVHGVVAVYDIPHAKTVVLTSGQSYFAAR